MPNPQGTSAGGPGHAPASADSPKPHGDKLPSAGRADVADAEHRPSAADESAEARERRLAGREVGPEDEERKTPGGPQSQVAPDVEPAGS